MTATAARMPSRTSMLLCPDWAPEFVKATVVNVADIAVALQVDTAPDVRHAVS